MATISAVIVTIDVTWRCLAQLLLASDGYRGQAMANWSGTSMAPIFAGTSQHGFRFAATEMSHFGGGGGARVDADGVDTAGIVFNTTPNMPNIEDQEAEYPVLYLFRRHLPDSGGPGTFRGGRSGELAYTVHDAPDGQLEGLFAGTGAEMPNAIGIAGGFPGAAIRVARVVETDLAARIARRAPLPARLEDVSGPARDPRLQARALADPRRRGLVSQLAGGRGLRRSARARAGARGRGRRARRGVRWRGPLDLRRRAARGRDAELDATARERDGMRRARLAAARRPAVPTMRCSRSRDRFAIASGRRSCSRSTSAGSPARAATRVLGAPGENLLPNAEGSSRAARDAAGPVRGEDYDRGRFGLRLLLCPACGAALDTHLAFEGAPRPSMRIAYR